MEAFEALFRQPFIKYSLKPMKFTGGALILLITTLVAQLFTISAVGDVFDGGWVKEGVYAEYMGNVTYTSPQGSSTSEGYMRWEITRITTDGYALVNMTMAVVKDGAVSSVIMEIDLKQNRIVRVDGGSVFNVTNYLWISSIPTVGQDYQLENLTAEVVGVGKYHLMGMELECYILNVTFEAASVRGYVERVYDAYTGLMVSAKSRIVYLGVNGGVDHECRADIVLRKTNIPMLRGSGLSGNIVKTLSLVALLILAAYILSKRLL